MSALRTRLGRSRVAGLLVVALAAGTTLVAGPSAAAGEADVLVSQTATLTTHAPGYPAAGTEPGRQLVRAVVDIEVFGVQQGDPSYHVDAFVDLGGEPTSYWDPDARVAVGFGHRNGAACVSSGHTRSEPTSGRDGTSYHVFGYTPDYWGGTPDRPWECVMVVVASADGSVIHDAMEADLVNTYEAPQVSIGEVSLLGESKKRLGLVRGSWTTVDVEVGNAGPIQTGPLVLTGRGRGLKVRSSSLDPIRSESSTTAGLRIKLTGAKPGKLTLRAAGPGIDVTRVVEVRAVKPPPAPVSGRYRSKGGDVSFTIRKGRVVGFTTRAQTRCGGYGTIPTYTQDTYDFPTTKIPRNGIVQASKGGQALGRSWSSGLTMRVAGAKITHGAFSYGIAVGPCSAQVGFTAKRVGR